MQDYEQFIHAKLQLENMAGFEPTFNPSFLFPFQQALVDWSVRKGRAAVLADCGLGKTVIELVWAQNIVQRENRPVLIITPLAVSAQTIREAEKFGIEAVQSRDGKWDRSKKIVVTNYQRLHYFDRNDFGGVICDESSILKFLDGAYRNEITEFTRKMPFRLLCTATASPNDHIELGSHSEALGELGYTDMLGRFFKNDQNSSVGGHGKKYGEMVKWRFKGHAETPFWRWVCSWARAVRRPSDLGFDDDGFVLTDLIERQHLVDVEKLAPGFLFPLPVVGLKEQRDERRRSINERCEKVSTLVSGRDDQTLIWCHLNEEGDLLEKIVPDAVQIEGSDSDEFKEETFLAFANGQIKRLVTKPKIGAFGLNLQNCHHETFFPSHSWEQYYQGVRRCLRYGQKFPVEVDIVTTEGEKSVLENLQRKAKQADRMFSALVLEMNNILKIDRGVKFTEEEAVPSWL
ncbi:MAG TPA: DEAD/DEAH box helicase family protein [Terriglobia bacterium]|nr:DEAD/DEAH box helicase family protein [Terriglobia bacterium]